MTVPKLDHEGIWNDDPGQISTWTKRKLNPLTCGPEDIDPLDIAAALSKQCRFNGHTFGHLSVARHCVWVAGRVWDETSHTKERLRRQLTLTALLHDAAEAYLGDLVKPLKRTAFGVAYLEAEARLEDVIAERFNLVRIGGSWPAVVIEADRWSTVDREIGGVAHDGLRWTWDSSYDSDRVRWLKTFLHLGGTISEPPR